MTEIDKSLEALYDILVDNYEAFENKVKELILVPEQIPDTNKFTWLLSQFINKPYFITSFLATINKSNKGDRWLNDYLFGVVNLIDNASGDEEFEIPDGLIDKLKIWLLDNNGELSWKAATLLKYFESHAVEQIQLTKLQERGDFFLTYAECILGLLRYDRKKHIEFVKEISLDETRDPKLIEFALEAYKNYR
jgi:hypothetical protein